MNIQEEIIIISDLENDGLELAEAALEFTRVKPSKITLLHSYEVPENGRANVIKLHDEIKEFARQSLYRDAYRIKSKLGIETQVDISIGKTYNSVIRFLKKHQTPSWVTGKIKDASKLDLHFNNNQNNSSLIYNPNGNYLLDLKDIQTPELLGILMTLMQLQD